MKRSIPAFLFIIYISIFLQVPEIYAGRSYSKKISFKDGSIKILTGGYSKPRPKTALVLSGGGSRGMVHIGVLKALEENNIPIDIIIGTSIGSVIGGLYASGYSPEQLADIMTGIDWNAIYQDETDRTALYVGQKREQDRYLLTIRFKNGNPFIPSAISPGQKILEILSDLILKAHYQARDNFDNLRVPFRSIATDLVSGKQVLLKNGNLAESINASLAIPLLFTPIVRDSMLLLDGGMRSNLPVTAAKKAGADAVIAVDVTSGLRKKEEINAPWEIVDQATTIMTSTLKAEEEKAADVLIKPQLPNLLNSDFSKSDSLIEAGKLLTEQQIVQINNVISIRDSSLADSFFVREVTIIEGDLFEDSVRVNLKTRAGRMTPVKTIMQDLEKLAGSGIYKQVSAEIDSAEVVFHLYYFPVVRQIIIEGSTRFKFAVLMDSLQLQAGRPLNSVKLQKGLDRIVDKYRAAGYSLMRVEEIKWEEKNGILTVILDEGTISDIQISGNRKTKDYVIMREFSAQKNKLFNWRNIRRSVNNVYSSQLYERVSTDVVNNNEAKVLKIKVKEKPSVILRIGGKYDTDRHSQLYLEYGDESFLGTGIKTIMLLRGGTRETYLGLKVRDDRIFTTYLTYNVQAYFQRQINPFLDQNGNDGLYKEERRGIKLQAGQQMKRLGQVIFELRQENIRDRKVEGNFNFSQTNDLRTFAVRALTDKRDVIDFPTKGIYNHWAWETGNRLVLGIEDSYTKAQVNIEGYFTFEERHTWHLKVFAGIGDKSMPFSEHFRLGGLHNFYGLSENEYFGRQMVLGSAAYRFKVPWQINKKNYLIKNTYLSLRYDFAGLWKDPELVFSSDDFFSGFGGYLGLQTSLGPMYAAYGRTDRGDSRFYFSLGLTF